MKQRLIESLQKANVELKNIPEINEATICSLANYLEADGWIKPPKELHSIVTDKMGRHGTVSKVVIEHLPLYVIRNPEKYYYRTREEALQELEKRKGVE